MPRGISAGFLAATVSLAVVGPLFFGQLRAAEATGQQLTVNSKTSGVYDFCLSFEDARAERDARRSAVAKGLSLQDYEKVKPGTRCYKNNITFIPLEAAPRLDGVGFVFKQDASGPYACPANKSVRCAVAAGATRYIKVQLLYGKLRFPVYVQLTTERLVDTSGKLVSAPCSADGTPC